MFYWFFKYKPNIKESIKHLRPSLALFISQLAIQIYTLLDKTMLGAMTDVYEVGLYENSQKTIKLALTLITSLGVVMLPRMSALHSEGKKEEFNKFNIKLTIAPIVTEIVNCFSFFIGSITWIPNTLLHPIKIISVDPIFNRNPIPLKASP